MRLTNGGSGGAHRHDRRPWHADVALLEVTRTQHEQRAFPVVLGQSVAIGVRRIHVLPTPLSSYTACAAPSRRQPSVSRQHPFLSELASRMKTRIAKRVEPALGDAASGDAEHADLRRRA